MTHEDIMKRCEEFDLIWQAMKAGKKFKHLPTGYIGFIDEIDLHTDNGVVHFMAYGWFSAYEVKPIEPVRRVKQPVALMQALVDGGYKCDGVGDWIKSGAVTFFGEMFRSCGKEIADTEIHKWASEWLEEVYE